MRVLIASKRAPGRRRDGGVQTWVATVRDELQRVGHEVTVADVLGRVDGGEVVTAARYDVAILSNFGHVGHYRNAAHRSVIISHGIVSDECGDQCNAFTSEEVARHWGRSNARIVRQPIDLEFWSPNCSRDPSLIVRYANRGGLGFAEDALKGCDYVHVHDTDHLTARRWLRRAGCVIATGRAAVEAMACGAPVVFCDDRPYQGPLMHRSTLWHAMKTNYSGRGGTVPNRETLREEVESAIGNGDLYRDFAKSFHDVRKIAPRLLEMAE